MDGASLQHVSASLENIFLLRHLRARAIEAERSRISRDLHDGILQTLLSIEIQLDVLRRKMPTQPEQMEAGLTSLQQTVKNEAGSCAIWLPTCGRCGCSPRTWSI